MLQIIQNRLYDLDTSTELAHAETTDRNGVCRQTLYKTRHGSYFVIGYDRLQGHPTISALTLEEAQNWMEHFCSVDEYINEFGRPDEA